MGLSRRCPTPTSTNRGRRPRRCRSGPGAWWGGTTRSLSWTTAKPRREHGAHEGRLRRAQGGGPSRGQGQGPGGGPAGGAGGQTRQGLTGEEGTGRNSPPPRLSHFNGLGINRALQFYYHLFYHDPPRPPPPPSAPGGRGGV